MDAAARFPGVRFCLYGTCFLLSALAGCASFSENNFQGDAYARRAQPAQATALWDEALMEKGYAHIGSVRVQREQKGHTEAQMSALLLDFAAAKGGDLVSRIYCREQEASQSGTARRYLGSTSDYTSRTTTHYYSTVSSPIFRDVYRITGDVWRHEPDLARSQLESFRVNRNRRTLLEAVSAGNDTEVDRLLAAGVVPGRVSPERRERFDALPSGVFQESLRNGRTDLFVKLVRAVPPADWKSGDSALPFQGKEDRESTLRTILAENRGEALAALVEAGFPSDGIPSYPPLHSVLQNSSVDVWRVLMRPGFLGSRVDRLEFVPWSPHRVAHINCAPVHLAAELDLPEAIEALAAAGADVEVRLPVQQTLPAALQGNPTALHIAAHRGRFQAARALLRAGADRTARTSAGKTPLDLAREMGRERVAALLEAGGTKEALDSREAPCDSTSVLEAARRGDLHALRVLADEQDLDARDDTGTTSLAYAVLSGDYAMIDLLLKRGANPNVPRAGAMMLSLTTDEGIQKALRAKGAVQTPTVEAIFKAVKEEDLDMMRGWVDMGVNVNVRDGSGSTPLHKAMSVVDKMVVLLLEGGADPNAQDGEGRYPADFALTMGYRELVAARGGKISASPASLVRCAFLGDMIGAAYNLDHGVNINDRDSQGHTPLTMATRMIKTQMMEFLLQRGADPDRPDSKGKVPLDFAALDSVREILLKAGARKSRG